MKTELKRLNEQHVEIMQRIGALQEKERELETRAQVGRCYRYRNCYSCPETPEDYFWRYAKVLRVGDDGYAVAEEIQKDNRQKIEFKIDECWWKTNGWQEISSVEYDAARAAMVKELSVPPLPTKTRAKR